MLERGTGELTYVNAGHDPPLVLAEGTASLAATGLPLGLWEDAAYEMGRAVIPPGATLLLFTDGLTDSIAGSEPEMQLVSALDATARATMANLKALVDPRRNVDDVTVLVVKRSAGRS